MEPHSISSLFRTSTLSRRFTIITVMFLSVLLGLLSYTIITLQKDQSNALLIDMTGRQRMLLQKHFSEVFLSSQGVPTEYLLTREVLTSTLHALLNGGDLLVNPDTKQRQRIDSVPSQAIIEKLREQKNAIEDIFQFADRFLYLQPNHPEFLPQLEALQAKHTLAIRTADQAVKQFNQYSETTITTMVNWEILIAIFVCLLGILVATKSARDGRKLEKEIDDRKRAETELQKSQMFLDSIVENIPDMIFVKTAKDLRFVRINKAGETLLAYPRQEILNKTDHDLFPNEQADFFASKDAEVLAGKNLVDISEEPIETKSNGTRYLHTKKIPILNELGEPQYLLAISEDITQRLQARDSLQKSEERYRALYEDNPSMYFTIAQNGEILSVNEFGAQQLGYSVNELVGLPVIELFLEEDRFQVHQHFHSCLQQPSTVFSWEFRKIRKDGSVIWVKEVARAVHGKEQEVVVLIVCEDISDRKASEHSLQEWKTLTESVLGQLPKGFAYRCLNNKNWTAIYVSDGIKEVSGFSADEFRSGAINYDSLLAPGEDKRVWTSVQEALANHQPYENEHRILTRTGQIKWILARGRFIFDDQGQLLYLDGLNVDITEQKQTEHDLRASETRFRSLIEHVPFGIHEIALDGTISSMNQAGLNMLGLTDEAHMLGRSHLELAEVHDHERIKKSFAQAIQGQPVDYEFTVTGPEKIRSFTKRLIPIRESDGNILKVVGIWEDITERKQAEDRLRDSEAKRMHALRQSDKLKSALLSSVSHELRSPLTAIKTSVSNIMETTKRNINNVQQEALKDIDQEINYMSRLVDNLLDMSQIEAGTLIPHREWHPLEDLLEGALRRTGMIWETRNIAVEIPEDILPVFVDALGIQQVLINLLDNAIKYSPPDSPIQLHIHKNSQQIEIAVSNTGEPLSAQDLERIFERFYRRPSPSGQSIRGTGLGLAICKGLVEAHGGRIWAESNERGVKITFTIPATESMTDFSLDGLHRGVRTS